MNLTAKTIEAKVLISLPIDSYFLKNLPEFSLNVQVAVEATSRCIWWRWAGRIYMFKSRCFCYVDERTEITRWWPVFLTKKRAWWRAYAGLPNLIDQFFFFFAFPLYARILTEKIRYQSPLHNVPIGVIKNNKRSCFHLNSTLIVKELGNENHWNGARDFEQ